MDLSLDDAAQHIAKVKERPLSTARRWLIGALASGDALIWAKNFDFYLQPKDREPLLIESSVPAPIPASFWKSGHMQHGLWPKDGRWPGGDRANWEAGHFRSSGYKSMAVLAHEWPDLETEAGYLSGRSLVFEITVAEPTVDHVTLDAIVNQTNLQSRARRLNEGAGRPSRVRSKDVELMKARLVLQMLSGDELFHIVSVPGFARHLVRQQAGGNIPEDAIRSFAAYLIDAANTQISQSILCAPID